MEIPLTSTINVNITDEDLIAILYKKVFELTGVEFDVSDIYIDELGRIWLDELILTTDDLVSNILKTIYFLQHKSENNMSITREELIKRIEEGRLFARVLNTIEDEEMIYCKKGKEYEVIDFDEDCGCWYVLTESEGIISIPENDYDILLIIKE